MIKVGSLVRHRMMPDLVGLVLKIRKCRLGPSYEAYLKFGEENLKRNDWYTFVFLKCVN